MSSIKDMKITPEQIAQKGVIASPDTLNGTADENKSVFDRLASEIIAPAVNAALDEMSSMQEDADQWATDEEQRKANEIVRQDNEEQRKANETVRQENEAARVLAEQNRKNTFTVELEQAQNAAEQAGNYAQSASASKTAAETAMNAVLAAELNVTQIQKTVVQLKNEAESSKNFAKQSEDATRESAQAAQDSAQTAQSSAEGIAAIQKDVEQNKNEAVDAAERAEQAAKDAEAIAGGDYIPNSQKGAAGGVATLDENKKVPSAQLPDMNYDPAGSAAAVQTNLTAHIDDKDNPHGVTAEQAGAIPTASLGQPGGVAQLGEDGLVLPEQLPEGGGFTEFTGTITERESNTLYGLILANYGGGN